jgi:DNA-binding MarR family transcriptional regulator
MTADDDAREAWQLMSDLVLDHQRRRQVAEASGMTFGRTRALRRLARRPMSMRELADALEIDPPNATVLVDDLEKQGLVRRGPHPTDRRAKLVEATEAGAGIAAQAEAIHATPPPRLTALPPAELSTLVAILRGTRSAV